MSDLVRLSLSILGHSAGPQDARRGQDHHWQVFRVRLPTNQSSSMMLRPRFTIFAPRSLFPLLLLRLVTSAAGRSKRGDPPFKRMKRTESKAESMIHKLNFLAPKTFPFFMRVTNMPIWERKTKSAFSKQIAATPDLLLPEHAATNTRSVVAPKSPIMAK